MYTYRCTYDVQVGRIYAFFLTGASIFTDGRFGGSDQEITSLIYSFNCTNTASIAKLKDCSLADNCTRVCDNPIGIQCYGNEVSFLPGVLSIPIRNECHGCYLEPISITVWSFFQSRMQFTCKQLSFKLTPYLCINRVCV